jgi:hypothetical protein
VITDAGMWASVWQQVTQNQLPAPALPEVDFDSEVVVLASMGTRNSGGYSIVITSASVVNGQVRIAVQESSPGQNCAVTGALTAPVHIVRVPRLTTTPMFVEQATTTTC